MAFARKSSTFTPVVMFKPDTPADQLAVAAVHSLMSDIYETMNTERSKQTVIGISEIGSDCRRCVARKLSGLYANRGDPSWKAQVGTFIHAGLEEHFLEKYADPNFPPSDTSPHYHEERRVHLLSYKGLELGGSCDLFVQGETYGVVCDWKTQGAAKLKKTAAAQIGSTYTVQMHTYGLGYEMLGFHVTHVVLYALPRDGELTDSKPVLMRYDRQIALDALAALQVLIDAAEILGWPTVIQAQDRASQCWDCSGYEAQESSSFLDDLTA